VANLTAGERKKIPTQEFALPQKRAYPIEDAAHARAALSRGAANASPAELAKIRRKVHAAYPDMKVNALKVKK